MTDRDVTFRCMGTSVRVVAQSTGRVEEVQRYLRTFDAVLSRFRPDSELCALNADQRETVPASPLLRVAVRAGLWAARSTDGLVDPTLVGALEDAGYAASMAGAHSRPLGDALSHAPARRPATADPGSRWREVEVDDELGVIRRPVGVRLDTGGTGKGLAADAAVRLLDGDDHVLVDCGGDLRAGGPGARSHPFSVQVLSPLTGQLVATLPLPTGGIATSGIDRRIWRGPDGGYAHHLIDPGTGRPAWTGLVGATAIAPCALEADVLAKAAVLAGPDRARTLLRPHGGILFHDDGRVERVGLTLPRSALRAFGYATDKSDVLSSR